MTPQAWLLIAFVALTATLLALDLGVFRRRSHVVTVREALAWSAAWIGCALAFNLALLPWRGTDAALQFLTGYLIELSLSVDNLFVFLLLFGQFAVPPALQHRVLFWGVLGAIVMRVAMIAAGATLIVRFHWILYLFGAFLVTSGARMLLPRKAAVRAAEPPLVGWLRRHLPVSEAYADGRFMVRVDGRRMVTPLFIVLVAIELSDLMFAVDSVPAIFAVTTDPFLVATSNIFAILGLRSLYFALGGLAERLRYLKTGLAVVLLFIGGKILVAGIYPIPTILALAITAAILAAAVVASLVGTRGRTLPADDLPPNPIQRGKP